MSLELESLQIVSRPGDNTGVGTTSAQLDSTGVKANSPSKVMQDSNICHDKMQVTALLLAASVDNYFWFCNEGAWQVDFAVADQTVAGGSGASVDVKVCTPTTAPASGTTQLSAAIDLATAGNNGKSVRGTIIASPTRINPGDRLALDFSGTLTALVGNITVGIKRIA